MLLNPEKCTGCAECVADCPNGAIRLVQKKAVFSNVCTLCGACVRVCREGAIALTADPPADARQCDCCPIRCWIRPGFTGACQRYQNDNGALVRLTPLCTYGDVAAIVGKDPDERLRRPLITGIGSGTTYPDCKPAPHIVEGRCADLDVVTVVTEAPLSYSSIMVKIDTDVSIGREGAAVRVGQRAIGMVETEQYGAKMLHIGGVNRLTGSNGLLAARIICDLANRREVRLNIENGSRLRVRVGAPPVIDGRSIERMRVGCGSATLGLFAPLLQAAADEVVILDSHITGVLSEHAAGRFIGVPAGGLRLKFRPSTPGRYFGDHGPGWGGTSIVDPQDIVAGIDLQTARSGMRILFTETTGQQAAMYQLTDTGVLAPMPLSDAAQEALEAIRQSCEPSLVSAVYMGGAGGSARAGVTRYPIKLTQAVHAGRACLSIGGAPAFVYPGGGITFMVDVSRIQPGAFYWTPTPATICPLEYTMQRQDYVEMGGHVEAMRPFTVAR